MGDPATAPREVSPTAQGLPPVQEGVSGFDETYVAVPDSVAPARHALVRWLEARPTEAMLSADIALAVSEACTNVVVHGYLDEHPGSFRVTAREADSSLRVVVSDDGVGMTPRPDSPGLGLGLPLMAALAESLEVRPAEDGNGTIVTMVFSAGT